MLAGDNRRQSPCRRQVPPMILVMPNGRAQVNDRAEGNIYLGSDAFAVFEHDLLKDVIPTIESEYSVYNPPRASGSRRTSMGGGLPLISAWLTSIPLPRSAAFRPPLTRNLPPELVPDPAAATQQLKLFWVSCGNKDGLIRISQGVHTYLKENGVPHIWHVDLNAHDRTRWRNNPFRFTSTSSASAPHKRGNWAHNLPKSTAF